MSESADSSSDETISYLVKDVDSDNGEFHTDAEPPTGPQPYVHEPVSARVEDEPAPSDGCGKLFIEIICKLSLVLIFYKDAINHL